MSADSVLPEITHALRVALAGNALSGSSKEQAERLLLRLEAGVRIVVLGMHSVGKSSLCNALLNHIDSRDASTADRVFCSEALDADAASKSAGPTASRRILVRANVLGPVTLIDKHFSSEEVLSVSHVNDTIADADVVIWCTQGFSANEAALWEKVPDALKDHSFLVLTKADEQSSEEELAELLARLHDVAEAEFCGFYPTTTVETEKLLASGAGLDEQTLASSGVGALRGALKGLIAAGCQADLDSATFFLDRFGLNKSEQVFSASEKEYKSGMPMGLSKMHEKLDSRCYDLAELTFDEAQDDMTEILTLCSDIIVELSGTWSEHNSEGTVAQEWCRAFETASDAVLLLAAENTIHAAADAATILLQLRRDIEHMQFSNAA